MRKTKRPKRYRRIFPVKRETRFDIQFYKVIDGAIYDTIRHHPEYFAKDAQITNVRNSLNKRIVGAAKSFLIQQIEVLERATPANVPDG
jgi:hypothetical protein